MHFSLVWLDWNVQENMQINNESKAVFYGYIEEKRLENFEECRANKQTCYFLQYTVKYYICNAHYAPCTQYIIKNKTE